MKINEIKINSYGKLKNKNLEFKDGINIVYGENERGKSTLLNSMVNILYGTSKNKKGKIISDYDKFKPWNSEEFSGKMSYSLDNNESYEIYREFGKKNPKVYNKNMEDVTKEYSIDKNLGSQFFLEQTGVDENTFVSTVVSFQNSVELDNQTQNVLLQKIANTSSTGDDGISYKKAIEKLNKKQLDEIGTSRSQGKPINIVMNEIQKLTSTNDSLKQYEDYKYEIEDKKYKLEDELKNIRYKGDFLVKLKNINTEQDVENEKLKYSETKIDELEAKIQSLIDAKMQFKQELKHIKNVENKKANTIPYIIVTILSLIAVVILFIVTKSIISIIPLIISIVAIIIMSTKIKKVGKDNLLRKNEFESMISFNKDIEKKIYEIDAQIEILEKSQKEQVNEAENIKNETIKKIQERKENLKSDYIDKISYSSMKYLLESSDLQSEIDQNNRLINDKNMELHRLNLDKENILPKLEELAENEEKISYNKEQYQSLVKKNEAINMVKEILENSYLQMKSNVTPRFTENLSRNIAIITNNKYKRVIINEEEGILVELENGEYKNANLLSRGTIDQLYLAFRLSLIEDISSENMPIIFDETFAFYDDYRLRDTLLNMKNNYGKKHQIILFTCTKREEEALKELNIDFNLLNL